MTEDKPELSRTSASPSLSHRYSIKPTAQGQARGRKAFVQRENRASDMKGVKNH